jgi:hypothetical protein
MSDLSREKVEMMARLIEGRIIEDPRFEVTIKGTVLGFPATLQALKAGWPFGVTYTLETQIIDDPNKEIQPNPLTMTLSPRMAHGIMSFFAKLLLFESQGQHLQDKRMEKAFIFSFNNNLEAERFVKYPGVFENLLNLHEYAKFSEMVIKAHAGLVLSQPQNFNTLDPDVYHETFKMMGEVGQILFEAF